MGVFFGPREATLAEFLDMHELHDDHRAREEFAALEDLRRALNEHSVEPAPDAWPKVMRCLERCNALDKPEEGPNGT